MQTINRVPQYVNCPLATCVYPLPRRRYEPPEPGGFLCAITEEFIPAGQEPSEGECQYLTGYAAAPPHALDVALARQDWAGAAEWLTEHVPAEVLRDVYPGMSIGAIYDWNECHPRADGRVENFSSYHRECL
jgi:hypothetical protein